MSDIIQDINLISPYKSDYTLTEEAKNLYKIGCTALAYNKFAVVILSGGQGTRLGTSDPKGLFKINDKTLFEYHIEKIKKNIKMYKTNIKLLIMTSEFTHEQIINYFTENENFDLNVNFFKQENSICTFENGEPIKFFDKIVESPNGNGNIFKAIKSVDIDDIYAINVISVDNILANPLDPVFVGAFVDNKYDILNKAIIKKEKENVGVFCNVDGKIKIIEYSESIVKSLQYANICNHLFRTEFIKYMGNINLPFHKAYKKISNTDGGNIINPNEPNGYKNESFIFDCFDYTIKNGVMCVPRELEFSPLKNNTNIPFDNPMTCKEAYDEFLNIKLECEENI